MATRRHGAWRDLALSSVAGEGLGLGSEMPQFGGVVGVQHRSVGTRSAQFRVRLVERLVAAGEQVQLRIAQTWVAVSMGCTIFIAQESKSVRQDNRQIICGYRGAYTIDGHKQ